MEGFTQDSGQALPTAVYDPVKGATLKLCGCSKQRKINIPNWYT